MAMLTALMLNVISLTRFEVSALKGQLRIRKFLPLGARQLGTKSAFAFTLLELVISIAITFTVLLAAALIAVSELRSSIKLYVYQSLRTQMARVTFLVESEVREAAKFESAEPADCANARTPATDTFLFALSHSYPQGPSFITTTTSSTYGDPPAARPICYFNRQVSVVGATPVVFDLYRYGPPFDAATGVLSSADSTTTLISPGTRLLKPSNGTTGVDINNSLSGCTTCDGHTLSYKISLQHDTAANAANPRVWNLEYSPATTYSARILSFCVSGDTSAGWCNN